MLVVDSVRLRTAGLAAIMTVVTGCALTVPPAIAGDVNQVSCLARTESSPGFRAWLPDCRAYEVVSESNSGDTANVIGSYGFPEGAHVYYNNFLPTPESSAGNGLDEQFLATRTSTGWVQQALSLPQGEGPSHVEQAAQGNIGGVSFADDFSEVFLNSLFRNPLEDPQLNQTTGMGVYRLLLGSRRVSLISAPDSGVLTQEMLEGSGVYAGFAAVNGWGAFLVGGSTDGSRAFFVTTAKLATAPGTPQDTHEASNEIFERSNGHTYLVGVLPNGSVPVCGAEVSQGVGSTVGTQPLYSYGAVAPSGANVVFSSPGPEPFGAKEPCNVGGLFLRDVTHDTTVQLPGAVFGGRAGTGLGEKEEIFTLGSGLHEYHVDSGRTTEISEVATALLTYSPDGTHVFFLGPEDGIFAFEEGQPPRQIPGTQAGGYKTGTQGGGAIIAGPNDNGSIRNMPVTTPDGSHLLFIDSAKLTAYDNCPEVKSEKICHHEAYVYDAKANRVTCISCNPTNTSPQGQAQLIDLFSLDGAEARYQTPSPPFISNDGSRAVFETNEALVPQDVNGTEDVYEWEQAGTNGCVEESAAYSPVTEGCIYMLSSGLGKEVPNENGIVDGTHLVGASENLQDVYIQTSESLLPSLDNASKLYDVRINGGFPYTPSSHGCEATQCRQPTGKPAPLGEVTTEAVLGSGNAMQAAIRRNKRAADVVRRRRLMRALRACRRKKSRRGRTRCVRAARKRFGVRAGRGRSGGAR